MHYIAAAVANETFAYLFSSERVGKWGTWYLDNGRTVNVFRSERISGKDGEMSIAKWWMGWRDHC